MNRRILYADDDTTSVRGLLTMRTPSLAIGLALGIFLSFATSQFEEVLTKDIKIAFFMPFVVYMAAAVGTQTQAVYTRDLRTGKASFRKYLVKETLVGIILGLLSSVVVALLTMIWFSSPELTRAVSWAMFGSVAFAPLIALLVTEILQLEHMDPAVGAGPIATVIQDTLSVVIYGLIASAVIL